MIFITGTAPKLQLATDTAATLDVLCSFIEVVTATGVTVNIDSQPTAINSVATTDILGPATSAANTRNLKQMTVRNKSTTLGCAVTVVLDVSGTDYEIHKTLLNIGEMLQYIEGVGFFKLTDTYRMNLKLRVTADVINATTSFADVTGLTCAVENAKNYNFHAHLYHISNATTSGARFGIAGPTLSGMLIGGISTTTASASTPVFSAGAATGQDTSVTGATLNGSTVVALTIMSGWFLPTAAGTFAIRCQSEIAVAAGLTVKAGSFCSVWEADA